MHYTKPHSSQTFTRNPVQEALVQQTNENNCKLYETATRKYTDTLDKIEYLKTAMPELYEVFLHSLYANGLYKAFDWIREIIFDKPSYPSPQTAPPKNGFFFNQVIQPCLPKFRASQLLQRIILKNVIERESS